MKITDIKKIDLSDTNKLLKELKWTSHSSQGRRGAHIHELYQLGDPIRRLALVRFTPESSAPTHCHTSFETIYVLDGEYFDEYGKHQRGEVVIYPPGSKHAWSSTIGATLLVVWDGPTEPSE